MARRNERPVEYAFLLKWLAAIYPETVLDVGPGLKALPALMANCGFKVRAIDSRDVHNRYFKKIEKLDVSKEKLDNKFDFITCISVLEHISDFDAAIANMVQMLEPGGHLCLTFPYNEDEFIPDVYKLPGAGYGESSDFPCRVFCWENISGWAKKHNLKLMDQERWECFTGEYWTCGHRVFPPILTSFNRLHHLTCVLYRLDTENKV